MMGRREGRDSRAWRRLVSGLAVCLVVGMAGCDRSSTAPEDDHGEPVAAQVFDRATGVLLAETDGIGAGIHWDGAVPDLLVGSEIALDVIFLDADGRPIPYGTEFHLEARFPAGAPQGVIAFSAHGDHLDVEAVAPGETRIVLQLYHGNHSDWDSPELPIRVVALLE
jgi:hypothetical protein